MFAVAQHRGPHQAEDLNFEAVIAAARRTVAIFDSWANPAMLRRCWCLHELHCTHEAGKPLAVALPPADAAALRGKVAANFGSLLMTQTACIDSERAVATLPDDQARILGAIRDGCGFRELNLQVLTLLNTYAAACPDAFARRSRSQPGRLRARDC